MSMQKDLPIGDQTSPIMAQGGLNVAGTWIVRSIHVSQCRRSHIKKVYTVIILNWETKLVFFILYLGFYFLKP